MEGFKSSFQGLGCDVKPYTHLPFPVWSWTVQAAKIRTNSSLTEMKCCHSSAGRALGRVPTGNEHDKFVLITRSV